MYNTRLVQQVVDWERRMQLENEKKGNLQTDKYALLPHVVEPRKKEQKHCSRKLLASLKSLASHVNFLG